MPRTRLSICQRKRRYAEEAEAVAAAQAAAGAANLALRPYVCDRCGHFHLTSRLKGKRRLPARDAPNASSDRPVLSVQDKSGG